METAEIVVLGGGVMGMSTAWQLARRGRDVILLERFGPHHDRGASHGAARNFNTSYVESDYIRMIVESRRLWRELEDATGRTALDLVGLVRHGRDPSYAEIIARLAEAGEAAQLLSPRSAAERWPQIRFDTEVLWAPSAGRIRAAEALTAMRSDAERNGADLRFECRVESIDPLADGVVLRLADGRRVRTEVLVSTAGAWTEKLLDGLVPLPPLRVTQEQPAHFAPREDSVWPTFMHGRSRRDPRHDFWLSGIYGMLTPGEGVKIGWHGTGPVVDPDHRTFQPDPGQLDALRRYAADWLPGVDPDTADSISCTYTTTRSEDFIIDRVGPIVVGAGFSGHGFKFAPVVGRMLADLAVGDPGGVPARFMMPTGIRRIGI